MAIGGSRTLKLSILADIDNLKKNLNTGSNEVEGFGSKVSDFGKKAAAAFAVAAAAAVAYAGKLLIDGVKSAIADEAAQAKLATTLENVTGATNAQIKATEAYITQTSLANGITDDLLRPSLDRLIRSTKDVSEAQRLQQLALDVSAGSGKELAAVTEALAKANEGNFGALKRLGVPLDENIIKTKDFDAATAALAATFEGQASVQADTFAGKMARLNVAFDEAKETVGSYILDAITPLLTAFVDKGIPAIERFSEKIGKTLGPVFEDLFVFVRDELLPILMKWWKFLYEEVVPLILSIVKPVFEKIVETFKKIKKTIDDNSESLQPFYDAMEKLWKFIKTYWGPYMEGVLTAIIVALGVAIIVVVEAFVLWIENVERVYKAMEKLVGFLGKNPILRNLLGPLGSRILINQQDNAFNDTFAYGGGRAAGGSVVNGMSYLVGERGPEIFTPNTGGMITPNNRMGGTTINLNVSGAIDPEGTARRIVDVLNNSFYRGTGGANSLQFS
jgi:hypothetical protein